MPLPLIIAGAALLAGGYGVKKGIDGYKSHSEADEMIELAQTHYRRQREIFDKDDAHTQAALARLGERELRIGASFQEFSRLADALLARLDAGRRDKLKLSLPRHTLAKIESYGFTATGVLGSVAGAGVAGVAAGFAVYGGVMTFAAASTGTAISALSGVAATNATLAAIGGGAISAGGLGMAGGTAILGAAVAAPVLAIAGWAYANHGEQALENALSSREEAFKAIEKMEHASEVLRKTAAYVERIEEALARINRSFRRYLRKLVAMDLRLAAAAREGRDIEAELRAAGDEIMLDVQNGYTVAAILTDLMTTPIFRVKTQDGEVVADADGVPEMDKDKDGSLILDEAALDAALANADERHGAVAPRAAR